MLTLKNILKLAVVGGLALAAAAAAAVCGCNWYVTVSLASAALTWAQVLS